MRERVPFRGELAEVFRITGRGTLAAIEMRSGDFAIGDNFSVGDVASTITGFEWPRLGLPTLEKCHEKGVKLVCFELSDDIKEQLVPLKGQPVQVFSAETKAVETQTYPQGKD